MKKQLLACVLGVLALSQAASAVLIGADQLLGIIEPGTPANPANELVMVNSLLEGWDAVLGYNDGAPTGTVMGDNPSDPQNEAYTLKFSATTDIPAAGTAPDAAAAGYLNQATGNAVINLGTTSYDWVLAKWGSDSAAYYIGGLTGGITLTLGGTGWSAEGHGLSGYTLFNPTIPDSGTTAVLMGLGILGLSFLKQRLS